MFANARSRLRSNVLRRDASRNAANSLCDRCEERALNATLWDFVAAFLQGSLEPGEVCYCCPPAGYTTTCDDGVIRLVPNGKGDGTQRLCKVVSPIHGMALAGRRWQRSLFPWMLAWKCSDAHFTQCESDVCVFHCQHTTKTPSGARHETLLVGCYVDDIFILSSHTDSHSLYHHFTRSLSDSWDVEDEGPVSDLLSIEITPAGSTVTLRRTEYIRRLVERHAPRQGAAEFYTPNASARLSSHQRTRTPCGPELPQYIADSLVHSLPMKLTPSYSKPIRASPALYYTAQ